jgi:hypothetical protein
MNIARSHAIIGFPLGMETEDLIQKTWVPEGTAEYRLFKQITGENRALASLLNDRLSLKSGELVLDVGGREGDISLALQAPNSVHIVDPDPTLSRPHVGKFWNQKIQNLNLSAYRYQLILCSHILGYLGAQSAQLETVLQLTSRLASRGNLILFFNRNDGYMGELLAYSKSVLEYGHHDYFDEEIFKSLSPRDFSITHTDMSFTLKYPSFDELSRCCWFLFGSLRQDINNVASLFRPRLKRDLSTPAFAINERVIFIERK